MLQYTLVLTTENQEPITNDHKLKVINNDLTAEKIFSPKLMLLNAGGKSPEPATSSPPADT